MERFSCLVQTRWLSRSLLIDESQLLQQDIPNDQWLIKHVIWQDIPPSPPYLRFKWWRKHFIFLYDLFHCHSRCWLLHFSCFIAIFVTAAIGNLICTSFKLELGWHIRYHDMRKKGQVMKRGKYQVWRDVTCDKKKKKQSLNKCFESVMGLWLYER